MGDQLLKVGQNKDKILLTKSQKEFNRLTKRIEKLRVEIKHLEEISTRLHQRMITTMLPLQKKYAERRAELVRLLDKAYRTDSFKSQERKKLEALILNMAFDLISEEGMDDLKEIYDRYSDTSYEEDAAEIDDAVSGKIKTMMEQMFGITIDDDEVRTPEEMQAFFDKQLAEDEAERWRQQEERQANRPKTAKQLEKEQKNAEEEQRISKSVREVYVELVKAFHPDLEPDEQEKQRKTEIMQRVIQAYENNDLLTLLQLQLEFEQIDQDHLESIAEDRLQHFIKILRRQVAELNEALADAQAEVLQIVRHQPASTVNPFYLEEMYERNIKSLKQELRDLEKNLQVLSDPHYLRMWLKSYRIMEA